MNSIVKSNSLTGPGHYPGTISFYGLLALMAVAAIPYGAAEPWWKAFFQCTVFLLAGLLVLDRLIQGKGLVQEDRILLAPMALIAFAFFQTVPWSYYSPAGISNVAKTVSADAVQTRLFIGQFMALVLAGWMFIGQTNTRKRLRILVEVLIGIGVVSAAFGLVRQAMQVDPGFGLPYLRPRFGYAQFINADHFAFLVEMGLGLAVGIPVAGGVRKQRLALYLIAAVPMWIALVLANSRAAIISMLCQLIFLGWHLASQFTSRQREHQQDSGPSGIRSVGSTKVFALRALFIVLLLSAATMLIILVGGERLARKLDATSNEFDHKTAEVYTLRMNIWRATKDLIKDHPVAGAGFGAYWVAISKNHHSSGEITPQEAHSDYLELLASGGLIGAAIVMWFAIAVIRAARRHRRQGDHYLQAARLGSLAGLLAVAIHSLVDFGLHITINALLFTVLVSILLMDIKEERGRTV